MNDTQIGRLDKQIKKVNINEEDDMLVIDQINRQQGFKNRNAQQSMRSNQQHFFGQSR